MLPTNVVSVEAPAEFAAVIESVAQAAREVAAAPDVSKLEVLIYERCLELNQQFMQAGFVAQARLAVEDRVQEVRCPECGQWADLLNDQAERTAFTVCGQVSFKRSVYRCSQRSCQKQRSLFDEQIGLEARERYTPMVQESVSWVGAMSTSYQLGSETLRRLKGWDISAKQTQRLTERVAGRARELQDKEVAKRGHPIHKDEPVDVDSRPETLVVEMDETMVMGRDGQGHGVKCATVFGLEDRLGGEGRRPELYRRAYTATAQGIKSFGAMLWALALSWGLRSAKRLVVIGDGGEWIWNYSRERFHFNLADGTEQRPVEILDYYHACENISRAAEVIFRDPEGEHAKQWARRWRERIRQGGVDDLIGELRKRLSALDGPRGEKLQTRLNYFTTHRKRMRYPNYEAEGLPIGSGAIEGTCKNLIKGRMACVGQRWNAPESIENMTALRVRIFNQSFDDLWRHREAA